MGSKGEWRRWTDGKVVVDRYWDIRRMVEVARWKSSLEDVVVDRNGE